MRKGDLVQVKPTRRCAFRYLTEDERLAWLSDFLEGVRQGRQSWHDDAGESKLTPRTVTFHPVEGRPYIVLRARVRAEREHRADGGLCELFDFETGKSFFVNRTATRPLESE
jgi:hypothetical protein